MVAWLIGAIAPTLGWLLALIIAAGAQLLLTLAERPLWRSALRRNGYVERIHPPHDRRDGPTLTWSVEGRAWCEAAMLGER